MNLDRASVTAADDFAIARAAFIDALRRGDAAAASAAYTDDARLLAPSAEVLSGRASVARFWQAGIDAGMDHIELESDGVEVEAGGEVATEFGRYVLSLRAGSGPPIVDRGTYLLVYRRQAGTWLRAAETFSPDLAGAQHG
jgi:ketosteroid isomerase-like protein